MKKVYIQVLLLCSLFFNVAHASLLAVTDECHTESVHEYIQEQSADNDCGDLCDLHHLFHFMAIVNTPTFNIVNTLTQLTLRHKSTLYTPPFQQIHTKPPIA